VTKVAIRLKMAKWFSMMMIKILLVLQGGRKSKKLTQMEMFSMKMHQKEKAAKVNEMMVRAMTRTVIS